MSARVRRHAVAACLTSLSLLATSARALEIEADARGQVGAAAQQNHQGPASSGSLLASSVFPGTTLINGTGLAAALAAQDDQGIAAARVDGACTGRDRLSLQSTTRWRGSKVNTGDYAIEYYYEFHITPPRLTLFELNPFGAAASSATWSIIVRAGNQVLFSASATATGGSHSFVLRETGTSLRGRVFSNPADHTFGYGFSSFDGFLSLGMFAPGQGPEVETILTVSSLCSEPGDGARGEVGDPLDLKGDPGMRNLILQSDPVSVTSATWGAIKGFYR